MKKIHLILAVICLAMCGQSTFAYRELLIQNLDKHAIRVIKVILDGQDFVVTSLAANGGDTLGNLIKKVGGTAGVNGTFFCPDDYSSCGKQTHSISERVFMGNGKDYSMFWPDTSIRMVFGFDSAGVPMLAQNNLGSLQDAGLRTVTKDKLENIYFGLGNFPVFLLDGEDVIYGYTNYIDSKMTGKGNRTFICSTQDKKTVYMGVIGSMSIPEMPTYLKKNFGCYNAINLDAGASIGMAYSGFILDQGSRKRIMDAFVVLNREEYINLTKTTPTLQTPYVGEDPYVMSDKENQTVKMLYDVFYKDIKKNGSSKKTAFIKILRGALDLDLIKNNPAKLALVKTVLFKLFVIGSI